MWFFMLGLKLIHFSKGNGTVRLLRDSIVTTTSSTHLTLSHTPSLLASRIIHIKNCIYWMSRPGDITNMYIKDKISRTEKLKKRTLVNLTPGIYIICLGHCLSLSSILLSVKSSFSQSRNVTCNRIQVEFRSEHLKGGGVFTLLFSCTSFAQCPSSLFHTHGIN